MPDHPQFIADCVTVDEEGSCGYMTAGLRPTTYQLMLPKPGGGVWIFSSMPIDDPARAMARIRGALYNHARTDGWGVAA
jgi:hypothetical protein